MEHVQKMVLVPQEQIDRAATAPMTQPSLKSSQTPGTHLTRLDAEMSEILRNNDGIDDSEKWERYNQVLQRYLHFLQREALDTAPQPRERPDELGGRDGQMPRRMSRGNDFRDLEVILATVPERYKAKAKKLVTKLQEIPDRIAWDHQGTVTINNAKIVDSSIVDLVNEAMRERKKVAAIVGRRQFAVLLHNADVPRAFVGNEKLWREGGQASPGSLNVPRRQPAASESSATSVRRNSIRNGRETTEEDGMSSVALNSSDDDNAFYDHDQSVINFNDDNTPRQKGKGIGKRHRASEGGKVLKWAKLRLRKN